jgi:hypothetical protein
MKLSKFLLTTIISCSLLSCGGGAAEEAASQKIDTKAVKGSIVAEGAEIDNTLLHNNDGEFDVPNIKFEGVSFMIVPTMRSFDEEWQLTESNLTGFGTYEMIEKKENSAFFKVVKDFMDKKTEGYNFVVWVKGEKTNYIIKGESENMMDPIAKKEDAEKAFKSALTFKPE